ncbi:MAG TPA: hypothetical protein P5165_09665 [Spirochaetia bacterium]|nr:hypothetical protein [Spirochaetia bacterium]
MKASSPVVLLVACLGLLSCSGEGRNGGGDSPLDKAEAGKTIEADSEERTRYHAELGSDEGIDAAVLDGDWLKVFVMTDKDIKEYDRGNLQEDMVVGLEKDLDNDGDLEKVVTGTYLDKQSREGAFLSVLDGDKEVVFTELVSDEPRLVHMRDVGDAIFFGTGYGSEYFKQITFNGSQISVSEIPFE